MSSFNQEKESREGFEPPTADSESTVLTDYTTRTPRRAAPGRDGRAISRALAEEGGGRTREPEGFGP